MADTFIPLRLAYTGSAVSALAEYESGDPFILPGNAVRLQANYSDTTITNRAAVQDSGANNGTTFNVIPNGTGTNAGIYAFGNSAMANASYGGLFCSAAVVGVEAGRLGTGSYLPMLFYAGGAERMRITTAGQLIIAGTDAAPVPNNVPGICIGASAYTQLRSSVTTAMDLAIPAGSGFMFGFRAGTTQVGTVSTNGSTTAYNTSSDYRLKCQVEDLDAAAAEARIMAYRPVAWMWNASGLPGKGFIAHEAQAVDSMVVTGKKDAVIRVGVVVAQSGELLAAGIEEPAAMSEYGEGATWTFTEEQPVYQGMDQSFMIPDMVAMLQKMRRELDETKTALRALQGA